MHGSGPEGRACGDGDGTIHHDDRRRRGQYRSDDTRCPVEPAEQKGMLTHTLPLACFH